MKSFEHWFCEQGRDEEVKEDVVVDTVADDDENPNTIHIPNVYDTLDSDVVDRTTIELSDDDDESPWDLGIFLDSIPGVRFFGIIGDLVLPYTFYSEYRKYIYTLEDHYNVDFIIQTLDAQRGEEVAINGLHCRLCKFSLTDTEFNGKPDLIIEVLYHD